MQAVSDRETIGKRGVYGNSVLSSQLKKKRTWFKTYVVTENVLCF